MGMKVSELRIGNHVMGHVPGTNGIDQWIYVIGKVSAILDEAHIKVGDNIIWAIDSISGIELTEEWLLMLGFEHSRDESYSDSAKCYGIPVTGSQYYDMPVIFEKGFFYVGSYGDIGIEPDFKPFKYVHQLQNLYFALTGEELILKP